MSRQRSILLVDDDETTRSLLAKCLGDRGYQTAGAPDGSTALSLIAQKPFDLVLLDVQMPRLDGYATARAVREKERQSDMGRMPIIALTAGAVEGERARCLQAGMDDFLTKPIDPVTLSAALRRWLGDAPAEHEVPRASRSPEPVQPASVEEPPDLDLGRVRVLRDLVPGNTAYLDRVIDNFLHKSPQTEQELWRAVHEGDVDQLAFHAHSLKGSAANLGLTRVSEVAELLQRVGTSGSVTDADVLLRQLAVLLQNGREALRAQRDSAYAESTPA